MTVSPRTGGTTTECAAAQRRTRRWRWLSLPLLFAGGCTVADNLSAPELLGELDRIVRVEGSGSEVRLRYERSALVSTWYVRAAVLWPFAPLLGFCFGRTTTSTLDNPTAHVRELLRELPDETGDDLLLCGQAAVRLGWIVDLETSAHSRVVGIDGLAAIATQLDLPLFSDLLRAATGPDPDRLAAARAGFAMARPVVRAADMTGAERLQPYVDALGMLTAQPLADAFSRLSLLDDLVVAYATEPDPEIRPAVAEAVRLAMVHAIEGALLQIVQGRNPEFVDLRLCAMELIRRLGGPRTVPLLLAFMAASPSQLARGESRYDPDPLVQLRLIHYCGQLRGELATTVLQVPGREGWQVPSPADFLAVTILNEQAYYSKLRTPALVALTWSLQRKRVDQDPAWVREWREGRR